MFGAGLSVGPWGREGSARARVHARRFVTSFAMGAALAAGCARKPVVAPPPPDVQVSSAVFREIDDWDTFEGRIAAVGSVDVRPRVSGYITRLAYAEGQVVEAGDLLFTIDARPYQATLASQRAQLERAQATELNTRLRAERGRDLLPLHAISSEEVADREAAHRQAVADVHAAQAAVARAALDLGFTQVRSPIAGRTSRAIQTVGNLVSADDTVLTSVVSQDPAYVYFDPDEQSYLRYQAALRDPAKAATAAVRIGLVTSDGYPFRGTVGFIDNKVDPATGTIRARAVVPNPSGALTPGLYARVQFAADGRRGAVLVADRAIQTDQSRRFVYVLGPGDRVRSRQVRPGKLFGDMRLIEAGLGPQDVVLVDGFQNIHGEETVVTPHRVPPGAVPEAAEPPQPAPATARP